MEITVDTITAWAKRRWFVYPWSDIYGWLANSRDFGPYGAILRKNVIDLITKTFVQKRDDILLMDAAILMHPKVRETSWHVDTFNDPLIDDKKTWERFRADKIIEDKIEHDISFTLNQWEKNWYETPELKTDIKEARKQAENKNLDVYSEKLGFKLPNLIPDSWTNEQQYKFITTFIIKNPSSKKEADRTEVRNFSLMLSTQLWVIEWEWNKVRLRPETAQWIYVNFKNLTDTTRMKIPFWAIQIGKAFRNEITPGNFIFRTREFEQAEMQYFVEPWTNDQYFKMFEELYQDFRTNKMWIKKENLRLRDHADDELAFYAAQARDFEYQFPQGWGELQGIHDRTDYDIGNHMKHSGIDMQYHDPISGKRYVPHIIETALWVGRAMFVAMIDAYEEEKYLDWNEKEATRTVLRFHKDLAPIKFAILPLIKKDENQVKIAKDIFAKLSENYMCEYDTGWAIGKRYRRQDEIGTPYCITVDHQSVEDGTVTVRDRDSMDQKRVKIEDIQF